jgi:hypothetical protein
MEGKELASVLWNDRLMYLYCKEKNDKDNQRSDYLSLSFASRPNNSE